jgi:CrcB protein
MGTRLLAAIFAGGAAGGLARAALERHWPADGHSWPWVTLAVNLAGTALLAYVITRLNHRPSARPLLGIGLCGALTTFSTLQLEALQLADNDHALLGATYAVTSIAAGLLVAYAVSRHPGSGPARRGQTPGGGGGLQS